VVGNLVINDFRLHRLQRQHRAGFVGTHHPAVTDDVSGKDGGQASFHSPEKLPLDDGAGDG